MHEEEEDTLWRRTLEEISRQPLVSASRAPIGGSEMEGRRVDGRMESGQVADAGARTFTHTTWHAAACSCVHDGFGKDDRCARCLAASAMSCSPGSEGKDEKGRTRRDFDLRMAGGLETGIHERISTVASEACRHRVDLVQRLRHSQDDEDQSSAEGTFAFGQGGGWSER